MVVALHTHPFEGNDIAHYICTSICRIAVPFFFCFSSFIFYKKGKTDIKAYAVRLLKLYCFWFVVELPIIYCRFFVGTGHSWYVDLAFFLRNLCIQNTFYAGWYITALLEGMVIVYWLSNKISRRWLSVIGLVCAILSLSASMYKPLIESIGLYKYYKYFVFLFLPSNSFIVAIPYCIIGKYLAEIDNYSSDRKKDWLMLGTTFILLLLEIGIFGILRGVHNVHSDVMISLFFVAPAIVVFLTRMKVRINVNLSRFFRKISILVYLLHGIFLHFYTDILGCEKGIYCFTFVLMSSLIVGGFIVVASKKIEILKFAY